MFNLEIAGLVITINNKYPYTELQCKDYLTEKHNDTGIVLSVTEERMLQSVDYKFKFDGEKISLPEAEFDAIHYSLYGRLHEFNGLWLHSVLIGKEGVGYAFTAAPGTGKSTHAKLWLEAFSDAVIVNGDNTIIRQDQEDGIFYGYGTPFCGKEQFNKNYRVPIKAICFLERADANEIKMIKPFDAIMRMLKDNFCIRKTAIGNVMRIYLDMAEQVKFYRLYCNMSVDAAKMVFEAIK